MAEFNTNMELISPDDPRFFTTYSEDLYDKHKYKLILKNGKSVKFECYDQLRHYWYLWKTHVDRVEVIDDNSGTGF